MKVVGGGLLDENATYDYINDTDEDYEDYEDHDDHDDSKHSAMLWVIVLYSAVVCVGLLGHVLLLAALVQKKRHWSLSDIFVLNLGVTDILLLLTLPLWVVQATPDHEWTFSDPFCKISGAVFNINFYCGIYLMVLISLNGCWSNTHTTQPCFQKKPVLAHFSCLLVWLLSLLLTIPDWIFLRAEKDGKQNKRMCAPRYPQSDTYSLLVSRLLYHILGFLLPAATLVICCSWMLLRLQCRSKRVILPLVAVFFLCWLPYNITLIVHTYESVSGKTHNNSLKTALMVTTALGCIHACLRPLLYFCLCGNFRKWLLAVFRCATDQSKSSLWELSACKEVLPLQSHEQQALKEMKVEQQAQC